jgi:hypothetical protein
MYGYSLFAGMGTIFTIILVICTIVLPISVYAAQKWAYKCYTQLIKLNENIEKLLANNKQP